MTHIILNVDELEKLPKYWSDGRMCYLIKVNELNALIANSPKADDVVKDAKLYQELIYNIGNKYPNETRHETALRYIRQAENQPDEAIDKAMIDEAMKASKE